MIVPAPEAKRQAQLSNNASAWILRWLRDFRHSIARDEAGTIPVRIVRDQGKTMARSGHRVGKQVRSNLGKHRRARGSQLSETVRKRISGDDGVAETVPDT